MCNWDFGKLLEEFMRALSADGLLLEERKEYSGKKRPKSARKKSSM